ncbi:TlpA family protein disulfide reductase [Streptacidiphilus jiangxiensis]|uniref:Peroxiredoxin n=1 Tax=Streptacidiphilus jiangxiensis TaxID=235985 RepID=A0A1H7Q5L8_STRJI|nr:TlpA disulfide reductase family protein [Streptacidiphilus jiangxiensis]SEL43293.1 Peroxiredoxin [Streptacidiphilus jiangxiensis]
MTRRRSLLALAALSGVLMLSACSGTNAAETGGGSDTGFVAGTGLAQSVPAGQRGAAINLTGKDLDGKGIDLASYRGKVVVLNVWGSWCGPCRAEAGDFETVYKADQAKGVEFVGINTRDTQIDQAQQFVKTHGLTYPSFYDEDGSLLLQFPAGSLNPQAIPSTLILDRQGRIAVRALEPLTSDQLAKLVDPVIAEKS